jgi:hypothetical protein
VVYILSVVMTTFWAKYGLAQSFKAMALSLKTDLVSELIANEVRPGIKEIIDPEEAKGITSMRTLLDKELGAGNETG